MTTDTMKTELRREAFERAMCERGYHDFRWYPMQEKFVNTFTQGQWEGWCAALDSQAAQAKPSGWTNVEDRLPPIDGETVFIGINTAGFACCFNNIESTAVISCFYDTAENSECLMSSLLWWRALDRPASPSPNDPPSEGVKTCPECQGSGQWQSACQEMRNCEKCDGRGTIGVNHLPGSGGSNGNGGEK